MGLVSMVNSPAFCRNLSQLGNAIDGMGTISVPPTHLVRGAHFQSAQPPEHFRCVGCPAPTLSRCRHGGSVNWDGCPRSNAGPFSVVPAGTVGGAVGLVNVFLLAWQHVLHSHEPGVGLRGSQFLRLVQPWSPWLVALVGCYLGLAGLGAPACTV